VLVARQNGKTHLLKVLNLFWLFIEDQPLSVITSTSLAMAKELFDVIAADAEGIAALRSKIRVVRRANGDNMVKTTKMCRCIFKAANRKGGRGLTINRLNCDELREHHDYTAYDAAVPAMSAVPTSQGWFTSNAGGDDSIVLNDMRRDALAGVDPRLGLFEYSAHDGADLEDEEGWAQANPNLGRRLHVDDMRGAAARARLNGGEQEAGYRTERLCQHVRVLNAAIDPKKWAEGAVEADMTALRGRLAWCLEISLDEQHAALLAAGPVREGVYRIAVRKAWSGFDATRQLREELPGLLATYRPRIFGWYPNGPAAALTTQLRNAGVKFPRNVQIEEIKGDTPAVCMGFAEQVRTGAIEHPDDELINTQVLGAEKKGTGDRWVFSRKGDGHVDVVYGAAGAVHLSRLLPTSLSMETPLGDDIAEEYESMKDEYELESDELEHETEL
jgi:hypothetical protein